MGLPEALLYALAVGATTVIQDECGWTEHRKSYCFATNKCQGAHCRNIFFSDHGAYTRERCQALCVQTNCSCFDWRADQCRMTNASYKLRRTRRGQQYGHTAWAPSLNTHMTYRPRVKVCIVGGVRSFVLPVVHESIVRNVVAPLRTYADVDVVAYLVGGAAGLHDPGTVMIDLKCNVSVAAGLAVLRPNATILIEGGGCEHFEKQTGKPCMEHASCEDCTQGWLQTAWVDECFKQGGDNYTHFIRVRPDAYFASPIPDLRVLRKDAVTSWLKSDSALSDQFFVLSAQLYRSWWTKKVRKQYLAKPFEFKFPHSVLFRGVPSVQSAAVEGCLARNLTSLYCGRGVYGDAVIGRKFVEESRRRCFDQSDGAVKRGLSTLLKVAAFLYAPLALVLLLPVAAAAPCEIHVPSPRDAVAAYMAGLYPVEGSKIDVTEAFEALDYFYAPRRDVLAPPRTLDTTKTPNLPYLPAGVYYEAPPKRRITGWIAGASQDRWWQDRTPLRRRPATKASGRASTVGSRFGPAPSWTNPLALVKYPFPLATDPWSPQRAELLNAATEEATVQLRARVVSGYVEVEQFGGPRWTLSGCPPVCGTWANVWRGTGVFLKVNRPLVAPNRLAAIVELIRLVGAATGGQKALAAFARQAPSFEAKVRFLRAAPRFGEKNGITRRRGRGVSLEDAVAAAAADAGAGRGCRCLRELPLCSRTCFNATEYAYNYVQVGKYRSRLGIAGFLKRVREARPEDWCANVCGTGGYYQEQPMLGLDAMLATLSCLVGRDAVVLTRSSNDNGVMHQEVVDFDLPVSLGGWGDPGPGALNEFTRCAAPFAAMPQNADVLLLAHWKMTGKWALSDVAQKTFEACDLANPGGGADAWTSPRGRDRCRGGRGRTRRHGLVDADRACYTTCRGHVSAAHANVSLTQVLRDDVVLCD